ncbi:DUF4136 domain-containing protein [Maribacter aestuarii]|uniref:DUF4136 domain-containing protein n=1 Tax=Maribacter aestuarii TaxID=1130723 RepID=UPI003221EB0A
MMKTVKFLLIFLLLVSCNAVKVNYDYEKETDFLAYNTYSYFGDMETGLSELDEKRLIRAMDIALQRKGLLFSEEPDILININSSVFRQQQGNSVGVGLGGGGRNVGGGVSIGIPVGGPKLNREIQIDFVDAKKDMLVWRALSQSPFKEDDLPIVKEQKIQELVTKIFSKYPPKQRN